MQILGPRPAADIGKILCCCDFALASTPRAVLEKSGAFMAYAFAGLAVLVSNAGVYGPAEKDDLPVFDADSWDWCTDEATVAAARTSLRARAHKHYRWDVIAAQALKQMHSVPGRFGSSDKTKGRALVGAGS